MSWLRPAEPSKQLWPNQALAVSTSKQDATLASCTRCTVLMPEPIECCTGEEPASPGSMSRVAYLQKLQAATGRAQALSMQILTSGELLGLLRPLIYTIALRRFAQCFLQKCSVCQLLGQSADGHTKHRVEIA